jgi:hypothetical protein
MRRVHPDVIARAEEAQCPPIGTQLIRIAERLSLIFTSRIDSTIRPWRVINRRGVQKLLKIGGLAVHVATPELFFERPPPTKNGAEPLVREPSHRASLASCPRRRRILGVPTEINFTLRERGKCSPVITVPNVVHRFEELIAGQPYQIEVASVAHDRWRAYIVRLPGVPTALMPFYGTTPTEAADQLCKWLTRAHARATDVAV